MRPATLKRAGIRHRLATTLLAIAVGGTALALTAPLAANADTTTEVSSQSAKADTTAAERLLGPTRSGLPWHSGVWTGGRFNAFTLAQFGQWRGRPADVATTYGSQRSYDDLKYYTWPITTWIGFSGRLNYSLPILPDSGEGSFSSIAAGQQDDVWRTVARNLRWAGRGDSIVRVGWEANLRDWRWQVTSDNADEFKAAFRRIVTVMRAESPELLFEFGIACGSPLAGSSERLAPLTDMYPGDDVVDLVGCDTYDWWTTQASNDASWSKVLTPRFGPGIQDVADFARDHDKGASYAEWGLARNSNGGGGGDNPFYIEAMYAFFVKNADVVAFECYFDEPADYIANSLFGTGQNPRAAAKYIELF